MIIMGNSFQEKKYRISLHYSIESGLAEDFIEIDDLEELKTYLIKELVSKISLISWNHDAAIEPKLYVENISVREISEGHLEWLINESINESRWLMAEDKLEKNHYPYISDGIVDLDRFEKPSVLYIMKEVNSDEKKGSWDLRQFLKKGARSASWNNISMWTYGIKEFLRSGKKVSWEEVSLRKKSENEGFRKKMLRQIAVMNLKKTPGGTSTNNTSLKQYVEKYHASLTRQFGLLKKEVDLIICCGKPTGSLLRRHILNPSFESWDLTSNGIQFKKLDDGPVIIYYFHPASRKRQEDLYNDLMDAVRELHKEGVFRISI